MRYTELGNFVGADDESRLRNRSVCRARCQCINLKVEFVQAAIILSNSDVYPSHRRPGGLRDSWNLKIHGPSAGLRARMPDVCAENASESAACPDSVARKDKFTSIYTSCLPLLQCLRDLEGCIRRRTTLSPCTIQVRSSFAVTAQCSVALKVGLTQN